MAAECPAGWPAGVGLIRLDAVDSTNDEARRRAAAGCAAPFWVIAGRQLAGRGRQGRTWTEGEGNLYATLLTRPEAGARQGALLSFAACLAVAELFEAHGGRTALKWPNDALLNGGKASGVLLESEGRGERLDRLLIGIGVNLVSAPPAVDGAAHPPTSLLAETGVALEPEAALSAIAARLAHWSATLSARGFAPLREAWLARAAKLGERIEARTGRETLAGVFEDVDAEGALVLRTPQALRRIHAADIYFR